MGCCFLVRIVGLGLFWRFDPNDGLLSSLTCWQLPHVAKHHSKRVGLRRVLTPLKK